MPEIPEMPEVQRDLASDKSDLIIIEIVDEISDSDSGDFIRVGADSDSGSECSEEGFKMVGSLKEIESPKEVESPRKDSAVELIQQNAESTQIMDDLICTTPFPSTVDKKNDLPDLPGGWPFLRPKGGANGAVFASKAPQKATLAPQKTFAEIAAQPKPDQSRASHLNQRGLADLQVTPGSSVFQPTSSFSPISSSLKSNTPSNLRGKGRGK